MTQRENSVNLKLKGKKGGTLSDSNWSDPFFSQFDFRSSGQKPKSLEEPNPIPYSSRNLGPPIKNTPHFQSKIDLLTTDVGQQVLRIRQHLKDKGSFFGALKAEFCQNPQIDLTRFKQAGSPPFLEPEFFQHFSVSDFEPLTGKKIVAVDGGTGLREYLGLDISVIKVSLVIYDFQDPGFPAITYFPPPHSDEAHQLYMDYGGERGHNSGNLVNFRRILAENSIILQYLSHVKYNPDVIILDGSIQLPPEHVVFTLSKTHPQLAVDVVNSFRQLFNAAGERNVALIGSIKDSSTSIFQDLLVKTLPFFIKEIAVNDNRTPLLRMNYRQNLQIYSDYEFLYNILSPHTRTSTVHQSLDFRLNPPSISETLSPRSSPRSSQETSLISQLMTMRFKYSLLYSYLRFSSHDLPLRIEYYAPLDSNPRTALVRFQKVLSLLAPISGIQPQCTIPLPQIEAHLRAHLPYSEVNMIIDPIVAQLKMPFSTTPTDAAQIPIIENRHLRLDQLF